MTRAMSSYWWVFLLRGVLAVIFGIIALLFPGMALTSLVLVFGAYALIDGISAIVLSIGARRSDTQWWMHLLEGVVGVIAGVIALIYPSIAALTLLYVIAAWAIVTGVIEIILAFRLRREITNEFWLGLGGLLSIAFGVYTLIFPGAGALALITLIAIYAIIFGVIFILLAFRLRSHTPTTPTGSGLPQAT